MPLAICAGAAILLASPAGCPAQTAATAQAARATANRGRILLVLPFDNHSGQPGLEWIREAAANLLTSRFAAAGFAPMTRADRMYALDHLGLPESFQPSRASAIKLAETLDADAIIVGSFTTDGTKIEAEGSVIDVPRLHMSAQVTASGPLTSMVSVFDSLAWKLTRQLDPAFNVAESTFVAEGKSIRLDAYEQYIRGITEPDQSERQRHLEQAVKLSPGFSPAWMALGRVLYQQQQYEQAADAFAKVDSDGADGLEAAFFRGLSLMFSGNYPEAEKAFAGVARTLPLAEVLNNEAVAKTRQGHDGTALFARAAAEDPGNPDYHFNLALSLKRQGNTAAALNELAQCLKLRPADSDAIALNQAWRHPAGADPGVDPLERIVRTFDAAAFRQAAQMLDQMDAAAMAALSPEERAKKLAAEAEGYLNRGLLLEAERLYRQAVAADPKFAAAHTGLGRVLQRSGDLAGARVEAKSSLAAGPTAGAWVLLAELDLVSNRLTDANADAHSALQLDPANDDARMILKQIAARAGQAK